MSNINRFKLKKSNSRAIVLCFILLISIFSQTIGYSYGAGFQITAKEDDVLMYKLTSNNDVSYVKFKINRTYENSTTIFIGYNAYFAENLTGFNETDVSYSNATLTGNISQDLFESGSILNLILPMGTNFSNSESELHEYFDNNEEGLTVELSIGAYGYSINIAFYVRLVLLVKMVEITYYYSTTGVLLQGDFYYKSSTSSTESNGKFEIIPEYSTISGADENPFNPADVPVSNSTSDEDFDDYKKFQMDTKSIITIVLGSLGFIGLASLSVFLIRRKRKLN